MANTTDAALVALSQGQAETVAAMAARIIPTDDLGPGADEAAVVVYIDRSLAGALADLLPRYLAGIEGVNTSALTLHGAPFAALAAGQQDALLQAMEEGAAPEFGGGEAAAFLELIIRHTREGMFCDPAYGGNRDLVGWRLLGFPGVQLTYTQEEQMGAPIHRDRIGTMADVNFGLPMARGDR